MKTEFESPRAIEGFHVLEWLWKVKEEISNDICDLSYAELMQYFEDREREYAEKGIFLRPA